MHGGLRQLQRDMRQALHDKRRDVSGFIMAAPGRRAADCLDVHRQTWIGGRLNVVLRAFPVLGEILGEACCRALCRDFVCQQPSRSPNLDDYPAAFPDWLARCLAGYRHLREYSYLPDLARLEWALYSCQLADAEGIDLAAFAGLTTEEQAAVRLRPAAPVKLLALPYPIYRIWCMHQAGTRITVTAGDIDGDDMAGIMVYRPQWRPRLRLLRSPEYALLAQLCRGETLATLQHFADHHDLALDQWLVWLLQNRCLGDFHITGKGSEHGNRH